LSGNQIKKTSLLLILFLFHLAHAEDMGQNLPDQLPSDEFNQRAYENDDYAGHLSNQQTESVKPESGETSFIPNALQGDQLLPTNEILHPGVPTAGTMSNLDNILTTNDAEDFKLRINSGTRSFSFYYLKDNFTYQNDRGIYEKTFRARTGAQEGGSLHFAMDGYFNRRYVDLFWNLDTGFGYNQDKGVFVTGVQSDTTFKLWTLPVDAGLGLSIPIGRWIKLTAAGGGSALGLYQSRNDRDPQDDDKEVRQIGFGYYAQAKMQISLSSLMSRQAFEMFKDYSVTNTLLDVVIRSQNYTKFSEEITISGTSYGLGFSFEYL